MTENKLKYIIKESLRDWFKKEDWVRISSDGSIAGPCGTSKNKKNPDRCMPRKKAHSMSKAERAATARKKKKAGTKGKTVVKNTKKDPFFVINTAINKTETLQWLNCTNATAG